MALEIPLPWDIMMRDSSSHNQYMLLRVIEVFGASTPPEERTWRRIFEAVLFSDCISTAMNIRRAHDLNELCKLRFNLCKYLLF